MKKLTIIGVVLLLLIFIINCKKWDNPNNGSNNNTDTLALNIKTWNDLSKDQQDFLDMVEKKAFEFFWENYNATTGLMKNQSSWSKLCGIGSVGFGLSTYCIADTRGWVNHQEVYDRVLVTLNSFYKDSTDENDIYAEGTHGLFYSFIDIDTGKRRGTTAVSTIGSAHLLAGILLAMQHFKGTEIEELAGKIYLAAQWDWFLQPDGGIAGSWTPENGLKGEFKGYNEYILVYLLALGSPTHPIPTSSWDVYASTYHWINPYQTGAFLTPGGTMRPEAYLYQFPACWVDFRGKKDHYADYWQNGMNALKANRQYCLEWEKLHDYTEEILG